MQIVLYSPGALQANGHANSLVSQLAPALAKAFRGHTTVLASPGPLSIDTVSDNVEIRAPESPWRLPQPARPGLLARSVQRMLGERYLLDSLDNILGERGDDRFVFFETFEHVQLGKWVAKNKTARYATFFHSGDFSLGNRGGVRKIYKSIARHGAREIADRAIVNYVFSGNIGDKLRTTTGANPFARIEAIPHPSARALRDKMQSKESAVERLGLSQDRRTVTLFGTMHQERKYIPVLDALILRPNWQILVAGKEGDLTYREIASEINKRGLENRAILRPGFVPYSEHEVILAASDLLALLHESDMTHTSGTLNMSRTYGVPVIFSGPDELETFVETNHLGWTVDLDASGVGRALDEYAELGDGGRQELRSKVFDTADRYSWDEFAKTLVAELLSHG